MTVVAVTGGTGFLGAAIVSALRSVPGVRVRTLIRSPDQILSMQDAVLGDLGEVTTSDRLTDGADVVIHAAGLVRSNDETALLQFNVDATARLAMLAKRAGVGRFVYISSASVYGHPDTEVSERSEHRPETAYARSKDLAESSLAQVWDSKGVTIIQPSSIIGVGHPLQMLRRFLLRTARKRPTVHAGAWTNYVAVDDVARTVAVVVTAQEVPRTLIVNTPLPLGALVQEAGHAVGATGRSLEIRPPFDAVARNLVMVTTRSRDVRLRNLVDRTRFITAERDWFVRNGIALDLRPVLAALAAEYGIRDSR